jgi:hypothetical protein
LPALKLLPPRDPQSEFRRHNFVAGRHDNALGDLMQSLLQGKKYFALQVSRSKNFISYSSSHLIQCKATKHAACVRLPTQLGSFPHSFSPNC